MKIKSTGIRLVLSALACLVLAAACALPAFAWNPGDATSPDNKWVKVNGVDSYQTESYNSKLEYKSGAYHDSGHIYILQHAIAILSRDGYDNWASLLQNNLAHLASGSKHADAHKGRVEIHITLEILWGLVDVYTWAIDLTCAGGCDHYHDLARDDGIDLSGWSLFSDAMDWLVKIITMLGPSQYTYGLVDLDIDVVPDIRAQYPSGLKVCQERFQAAKKAWDGKLLYPDRSALDSAFYELGWACHLLSDLAVAQHLHGEFIGGHSDYEDAADGLGDDTKYPNHHATTAKGLYCFSSVSGSQAVRQLGLSLANTIYPDSDHHQKAEKGNTSQRQMALKKALPPAEKHVAALMAQFLHEAGIPSTTPPLEGYVRDTSGGRIPYAYVFYAPAGYTVQIEQNLSAAELDPKKDWKGWSLIRADANGLYKLPVKKFRKYWLRPAMPGYSFRGETEYNREFGAKTIPALYSAPTISYSKDTLDLYMDRQPAKAVLALAPGQQSQATVKTVKFAGLSVLQTGYRSPLLKPGQALPLSKTSLTTATAEGIYRGVLKADCSASALQTKGSKGILGTSARVVLRVQDLVSVFDGKKLQTTAEVAAVVDKAQLKLMQTRAVAAASAATPAQPLQKQQPSSSTVGDIGQATFAVLQSLLPAKTSTAGAGKGRKLLSAAGSYQGDSGASLLIENGLLLVPAAAGVTLEVAPDSGTGLLSPADASLTLTTDDSGAASFTVQSGTHAGKLVLRYKVVKNTEALDIKPEGVVEILIQPGLDDADPAVETPATLTRNIQVKLVPEFMPLWSGLPYFRERIRIEPGVLPGARPDRARLGSEADRPREPEPGPEARRRGEERREERGRPAGGIDIGGEWHSNVPGAFLVKQEGEKFTWEGIDLRQTGRGRIAGRQLEASWEGAPKSGRAEGEVVEATDDGWAFRIHWSNGMVFFREPRGGEPDPKHPEEPRREEPPPPREPEQPRREEPQPPPREPERPPREEPQPPPRDPQPQPQPQPQQQPVDISGSWTSNMRVVYQVRQQGSNFSLYVSGQPQAHQGTINGRTLQSSWPGRPAAEKVAGEVVQVSDKGRALVIRWSNGIEFKR